MKSLLKVTCLFLLVVLLLPGMNLYARQDVITVSGKILAADDNQPVPHVNISVEGKGIATASNNAGLFALIIPAGNSADTLKISCIGFKTKQLPISGLKSGERLNIALDRNITELNAVDLAYYDPVKVIQKAIERIPFNYINQPHVLRGFYRMYTYNDTNPLQLSEAVFDVYNFGYGDQHADQFKLVKARTERNERDFSSVELGQKPNSVFEDDLVNHRSASGFLSNNGMLKHKFHASGITDFQGYEAYEIDFTENEGDGESTFRGRMFIDTKTYAFIYFDFGMSPLAIADSELGNFISHALVSAADVDIDLLKDHTTVTYQEVGHKWVLANVEGNHLLSVKNETSGSVLPAQVKFNYQVTSVDTAPKSSFGSKFDRGENINNHNSDEDSKFWKDYNILLSDYNSEDIFKQLQSINLQKKQAAK